MMARLGAAAVAIISAFAWVNAAHAEVLGQPHDWGMRFQTSVTSIMDQTAWFEGYTLVIITAIAIFVLGLMVYLVVKFNERANPEPDGVSHNTLIEVVWTIVPVLILVAIAFPSFRLLYAQTTIPAPDLTVKAIGGSWYWQYEYMDEEHADVPLLTSNMLNETQRAERKDEYGFTDVEVPRLLAVDYPLVVPEGAVVHVLSTSLDVNHAVAVPAFGIKHDAIQGRLNESWFEADTTGVFYGQCSQLCGARHAFMPLEVRVVSQERFDEWVELVKDNRVAARDQLLVWQQEDMGQPVASLIAE